MTLTKKPEIMEMLRLCDQALLMGDAVFCKFLSKAACMSHLHISASSNPSSIPEATTMPTPMPNKYIPPQNISTSCQISQDSRPSLERFFTFMKEQTPLLISDAMAHWPAFNKWNVEHILQVHIPQND